MVEDARALLESIRWPGGPVCTHCEGAERVYRLRHRQGSSVRPGVWKCGRCRKQFTVTMKTVFEETRLPLEKWVRAIRALCAAPEGATASQLTGLLDVSAKTAGSILARIHYAATQTPSVGGRRDSILKKKAGERRESLYPLSLEAAIAMLLRVPPARKHPEALERRVAEMEVLRRRREAANQSK